MTLLALFKTWQCLPMPAPAAVQDCSASMGTPGGACKSLPTLSSRLLLSPLHGCKTHNQQGDEGMALRWMQTKRCSMSRCWVLTLLKAIAGTTSPCQALHHLDQLLEHHKLALPARCPITTILIL